MALESTDRLVILEEELFILQLLEVKSQRVSISNNIMEDVSS